MKISRLLSFLLFCSACGGGAGVGAGAEEPAATEDVPLEIGGCDQRAVDAQVEEIDPRALPWTYLVVNDAEVQCDERRVMVHLGPGASVLLVSVADDASGAAGARVAPQLVRAIAQQFGQVDPNARYSAERQTTLGEAALAGHCGRVDFTSEGQPFIAHICSAWKTTADASHFVVVSVADTERNFAEVGMSVDELVGGLVDGLTVE